MKNFTRLVAACLLMSSLATPAFADPVGKTTVTGSTGKKKSTVRKPVLQKGSFVTPDRGKTTTVYYSKRRSKSGKQIFVTEYNVFSANKQLMAIVRAEHNKAEKKVTVSVRDMQVPGTPIVNTEVAGYATPFMGRFGSIGKVGTANKSTPGQISVKFLSKRFDYVNVVSISDTHEDSGRLLQVYVLDEAAS